MTKDEALTLAQRALSNKNASTESIYRAVHAIKEALAQPEPDLTEQQRKLYQKGHNDGVAHHKQAVKAAQPEQDLIPEEDLFVCGQMGAHVTRVYAKTDQEPVAWPAPMPHRPFQTDFENGHDAGWNACLEACKEAITPPKQEPLTDEQIEQRIGYRLPAYGFDAIRQLIKENT